LNSRRTLRICLAAAFCLVFACAQARDAAIVVTESGLYDIDGRTRFDAEAVRRALLGMEVRAERREGEGGLYSVLIAAREGVDIITLYGAETVVRADIVSADAATGGGARIGDPFSAVFSGSDARYCEPGMEVFSGKAVCLAPGSDQIALIFGGRGEGPDGMLPEQAALNGWRLEMIIWNAEF